MREIEAVYRSRYLGFRNALATVTGSQESARDVVQDAFVEALRRRQSFRGEGALEAWIWRIALRLAFARGNAREVLPLTEVAEPEFPEPGRNAALAEAVRRLPPRRRLVVFLRYFGDLSYGEIAEVCGMREGTVAATLAQARNELLHRLEQRGESA